MVRFDESIRDGTLASLYVVVTGNGDEHWETTETITILAPEDDTPAGQIAYQEIRAPYEDLEAVERFARDVEVVTDFGVHRTRGFPLSLLTPSKEPVGPTVPIARIGREVR